MYFPHPIPSVSSLIGQRKINKIFFKIYLFEKRSVLYYFCTINFYTMNLKIKYKKSKIDFSLKDRTLYAILLTFGSKILYFIFEMLRKC